MWFQICNVILGIWLLISPMLLGSPASVARLDRTAGPIAIAMAVLALRDVTRTARMANVITGMCLLITIATVTGVTTLDFANTLVVGWLLIAFSIPRGAIHKHMDGGWRAVVWPDLDRYFDV